jgi:hypothetical protein
MTIDEIKEKVEKNQYEYTLHAEIERRADDLTFYQIEEAILAGDLLVGFSENIPIHVVCGGRGGKVVIITVYVPKPPKFVDPWTRSREHGK